MKLILVTHWRIPSEKTMAPYMMRVAEAFAKEGSTVEFWVPRRRNPLAQTEPFAYHGIDPVFTIRRLPVLDLMEVIPGPISFLLMMASWVSVLFFTVLFEKDRKKSYFYFFDLRDAVTTVPLSKNVFSEIHMYYRSGVDRINRFVFARLRGVIVPTKPMMPDIQERYAISDAGMIHAPCGVNFEQFGLRTSLNEAREALGLPQNKKIILYVGHLFPVKGVDVLFDVHTFLKPDEVIYFVGGTDEDLIRFRKKWTDAGAPENIVIAGRKPHQEIPLWLRSADILSIPNTAKEAAGSVESSPSKQMEYMAVARPIVASDVPGIRDVMDDSMAFYCEPDSSEAIAGAIRQVLDNPDEARRRAENARETAKTLGWGERAKKIISFMERRTASEASY